VRLASAAGRWVLAVAVLGEAMVLLEATVVNVALPSIGRDLHAAVARAVLNGEADLGLMICGTGIGSGIAANKIPGIRAAVCSDIFSARYSRLHNNANLLCLGERVVGVGLAKELIAAWIREEFCGEPRHQRRLDKVTALETPGSSGG
jgi:RpiB/LacA/LacB family sugar-phosphate isomerase